MTVRAGSPWGVHLIALGRAAAEAIPLASAAAEPLAQLRSTTGESAQLYVREGDERVCIAALESLHGLRTIVPMGASLPLGVGSAGRILATRGPSAGAWVESIGEREAGVASVSAPVCDAAGQVVAAVGVSGPIERTHPSPRPPLRHGRHGGGPGHRAGCRAAHLTGRTEPPVRRPRRSGHVVDVDEHLFGEPSAGGDEHAPLQPGQTGIDGLAPPDPGHGLRRPVADAHVAPVAADG